MRAQAALLLETLLLDSLVARPDAIASFIRGGAPSSARTWATGAAFTEPPAMSASSSGGVLSEADQHTLQVGKGQCPCFAALEVRSMLYTFTHGLPLV